MRDQSEAIGPEMAGELEVRHTAQVLVASLLAKFATHGPVGLSVDLTAAELHNFDARGATFRGEAIWLNKAVFTGTGTWFNGATFASSGRTIFYGVRFLAGKTTFADARFTAGTINFRDAQFDSGGFTFQGATFQAGVPVIGTDGTTYSDETLPPELDDLGAIRL